MQYYSEKLNKLFDSVEELEREEGKKTSKSATKKTASDKIVNKQDEQTTPTRKQLAIAVEAADEAVKEAYAKYEAAKAQVEELSKKYLEETDKILEPAKAAVKNAEQNRYEAIRKFNDSYGAYQVTYTGARAADELMKAINRINSKAIREFFWL